MADQPAKQDRQPSGEHGKGIARHRVTLRDVIVGVVSGIVVAAATMSAQAALDDSRDDEAERRENLRFVRELAASGNVQKVSLGRIDLSGRNLSGLDLSGVDLQEADLSGADLSKVTLSGANLQGADLSNAFLSGATLVGTDLLLADLSNAILLRTDLSESDLSQASMIGADLAGVNLTSAHLNKTDLSNSTIRPAKYIVNDSLADRKKGRLGGDPLEVASQPVILEDAWLMSTDLSDADVDIDFEGAHVMAVDISGTDIPEAILEKVKPFNWTPAKEGITSYGPLPGCGPPNEGLSESACIVEPFAPQEPWYKGDRTVIDNHLFQL